MVPATALVEFWPKWSVFPGVVCWVALSTIVETMKSERSRDAARPHRWNSVSIPTRTGMRSVSRLARAGRMIVRTCTRWRPTPNGGVVRSPLSDSGVSA